MKLKVAGFGILLSLFSALVTWILFQKREPLSFDDFINQKWPKIQSEFPKDEVIDLSQINLESRPDELVSVDQFLPIYSNFNINDVRSLYQFSQDCQKKLKPPRETGLLKAFQWISFHCGLGLLPKDFFKRPPYIFLTGTSYVRFAELLKFNFSGYLDQNEIEKLKTISEILEVSMFSTDLNAEQIKGWINGESLLIGANYVYLKKPAESETARRRIYFRSPRSIWNQSIKNERFFLAM